MNYKSGGVKGSSVLSVGDVVSVRGMGRLEIEGAEETKKGRFAIRLKRFR